MSDVILLDLVEGRDVVCTRFVPSEHAASGVKRWIAYSDSFAKGEIHINRGAYEALIQPKAVSLLPVGIERVEGEFEKDDIVRIVFDGVTIGVGRASFDSAKAAEMAGKRGAKPLIHYDYLYIEQ
jgi:glutamate 5-kinase